MILYKKDSKDKIRFVEIYPEGDKVVQKHGILDGAIVYNESKCIGKNIGKSNETTPERQAELEAQSKLLKKLDEGYYKTIDEANNETVVLPMLAKDFKEEVHKVSYPVYVQPKYDGMRCLKQKNILKSRKNKEIDTMPHIMDTLAHLNEVLDGELYAHGLSFQENMKLIKKYKKNKDINKIKHILKEMCEHEYIFDGELYAHGKNFQENIKINKKYREGESEEVKYHVYDLVIPDLSFKDRYDILEQIINNESLSHIELVPTYLIYNKEELNEIHEVFLKDGYEGTIVRLEDGKYEINKRSSSLLKYKDFKDISCKIIEVMPSEKRPKQGIFICEHSGNFFGCGMKFSHAEREEILINKENYIGKTAEIRFFEYTEDGIPRFPVAVGIRLDK